MIHKDWKNFIEVQKNSDELQDLMNNKLSKDPFVPKFENIFKVFRMGFEDIKVVILGQDPYHSPLGMSTGLAFQNGIKNRIPPSLRNIYKELKDEGFHVCDIDTWEEQGVFLLNTALTCDVGLAGSHLKYWQRFTEGVIHMLSVKCDAPIFLLWGRKAQQYKIYMLKNTVVTNVKNIPLDGSVSYVFESAHPSPFSARNGFFDNKHFENANRLLSRLGKDQIIW